MNYEQDLGPLASIYNDLSINERDLQVMEDQPEYYSDSYSCTSLSTEDLERFYKELNLTKSRKSKETVINSHKAILRVRNQIEGDLKNEKNMRIFTKKRLDPLFDTRFEMELEMKRSQSVCRLKSKFTNEREDQQ